MLDVSAGSGRDIHFIHCALNSRVHAFRDHVDSLAIENENIQPHYIYSNPLPDDRADSEGFIDEEKLTRLLPEDRDVDLYFLGPKPFMQSVWSIASDLGIPERQIRYEFFGPLETLRAS